MTKTPFYDVVIIGAGPGGLFAAYEIIRQLEKAGRQAAILVVDRGKTISERNCHALREKCIECRPCRLVAGEGGAGLFSDGKLVFDLYSGGHLREILNPMEKRELEGRIKSIICAFSKDYVYKEPENDDDVGRFNGLLGDGLTYKPYPVLHLGSTNLRELTSKLRSYLQERSVNFLFDVNVSDVYYNSVHHKWSLKVENSSSFAGITSRHVIVSVGKEGNFWFSSLVEGLGGETQDNNTYIGVRMEISDYSARRVHDLGIDPKFYQSMPDARIKTHCFCNHGEVLLLKYFGLPVVGGHSPSIEPYGNEKFKYSNSNWAFLYRNAHDCTREQALSIMKKVHSITGGNLLVQRLGDYLDNVPTTLETLKDNRLQGSNSKALPGYISTDLLPGFREVFLTFLHKLSSIIPDIMYPDNLLYAPAIEWWMKKIRIANNMEVSNLTNLYTVGDGGGWTQGIVQSSATGLIAARTVAGRILGNKTTQPGVS